MRNLALCGLLLALSVTAFPQSTPSPAQSAPAAMPANADDSDYAALREKLAARNKVLTDQVNMQRAEVKKNQDLLKEAQKLDASNKKLEAEKQRLEAQNQDLQKQREALKAAQPSAASGSDTASVPSASSGK